MPVDARNHHDHLRLLCEIISNMELGNEFNDLIPWPEVCNKMQDHGIQIAEDECIKLWLHLCVGIMENVNISSM